MTPTEELVLEVLAGRWRLGERLWTFSSRHGKALRELEELGYVTLMHGTVENTIRAGFTDQGRKEWLMDGYTAPALAEEYDRGRRDAAAYLRDLYDSAGYQHIRDQKPAKETRQ